MPPPSGSELALLKLFWQSGPMSAREVQEVLPAELDWAASTTRTVLERMKAKGLLSRRAVHGMAVYAPAQDKVSILGAALTAVHVSHTRVMRELSVQITPQKLEPPKDDVIAPPPQLTQPAVITVPPPEVSIAPPVSPIQVQQAVSKPAPPPAVVGRTIEGERRCSSRSRPGSRRCGLPPRRSA